MRVSFHFICYLDHPGNYYKSRQVSMAEDLLHPQNISQVKCGSVDFTKLLAWLSFV